MGDEASEIQDAHTGPRPLVAVGLAAAAVAVGHGFGRLTYPFVLPAMVDELVGSYSRAGALGMTNLVAYLAGVLVVIRLSSSVALARFIQVGLLGVTAGLAVLAVAPSYLVLIVGMVFTGGFNAAIWVPASALITSSVPARHRGTAAGALGMGFGIAIVFAGQLTRVVQSSAGEDTWRPVWAVEAGIGVVVVIAVTVGLRTRAVARPSGPPAMRALRRLPGAAALIVSYAGFAMGYVVFSSYLVAALQDDAGFSAGHASAVYSLVGLFGILGGLLVGRLSDRIGRRNLMVGAHLLMAASAFAVLLGGEPWVAIAAACFGVFASGMPAVVAAYVADHLEPLAVAGVLGVVTIAFGVSQAIGPLLGGWLADASNAFVLTFLLSATAHLVGAAAGLALPEGGHGATVPPGGRTTAGVTGGRPGGATPHP